MGKQKTTQPKTQSLYLDKIDRDAGTQIRLKINQEVVEEYAECMKNGDRFPPITVFKCKEGRRVFYTLADGFHRCLAAELNKQKTISCEILEGEARDALEYALKANSAHGLRRTNKDKRNAVKIALKDEEWVEYSNNEIARLCAVSEFLVRTVRKEVTSIKSKSLNRIYKTRHGTIAKMKVKSIGNWKKDRFSDTFNKLKKQTIEDILSKKLLLNLSQYSDSNNLTPEKVIKKVLQDFLKKEREL